MNPLLQQIQNWLGPNAKAIRALMAPLVVVMILAMMVLPLPPFALDLLFTFNIAMALMVMMVAAYMVRPLDFAAFPAVILLTTLLRLSLNVASTRVVLLQGHTGLGQPGADVGQEVLGRPALLEVPRPLDLPGWQGADEGVQLVPALVFRFAQIGIDHPRHARCDPSPLKSRHPSSSTAMSGSTATTGRSSPASPPRSRPGG